MRLVQTRSPSSTSNEPTNTAQSSGSCILLTPSCREEALLKKRSCSSQQVTLQPYTSRTKPAYPGVDTCAPLNGLIGISVHVSFSLAMISLTLGLLHNACVAYKPLEGTFRLPACARELWYSSIKAVFCFVNLSTKAS